MDIFIREVVVAASTAIITHVLTLNKVKKEISLQLKNQMKIMSYEKSLEERHRLSDFITDVVTRNYDDEIFREESNDKSLLKNAFRISYYNDELAQKLIEYASKIERLSVEKLVWNLDEIHNKRQEAYVRTLRKSIKELQVTLLRGANKLKSVNPELD